MPHLIYLIRSWICLILSTVHKRRFLRFLPKCTFSASIVCAFWVSQNKLIKFHKTCKSWVDTRASTVRCLLVLGVLAGFEILSVAVSAAKQSVSSHLLVCLCVLHPGYSENKVLTISRHLQKLWKESSPSFA